MERTPKRRVQNWSALDDLKLGIVTIVGLAGGIGIPALVVLWLLDGRF